MATELVLTMLKYKPWADFFFWAIGATTAVVFIHLAWSLVIRRIAFDILEYIVKIKLARSDQLKREISDQLAIAPYLMELKQANDILSQMGGSNSTPQKMDIAQKALVVSNQLKEKAEALNKVAYQLVTGE